MRSKKRIVTCKETGTRYDESRLSYVLDDTFRYGDNPVEEGQQVTLKVRRKPGRYRLISAIVEYETYACSCGACDYTADLVAVPVRHAEAFESNEAAKPSFDQWAEERDAHWED